MYDFDSRPVFAGIQKVLLRGTAEILERDRHGIFLRDTISGGYMVAADSTQSGIRCLTAHEDLHYALLSVCCDQALADFAATRYGLTESLDCYQAVYRSHIPPNFPFRLAIRPASLEDLPWLTAHYDKLSPGEISQIIRLHNLFLGEQNGTPVGFIGEHLEGSMGLLYILPAFRGLGYATELERCLIHRTLARGFQPFCQVETNNLASLALQKKLGLEISCVHVYWMWSKN